MPRIVMRPSRRRSRLMQRAWSGSNVIALVKNRCAIHRVIFSVAVNELRNIRPPAGSEMRIPL